MRTVSKDCAIRIDGNRYVVPHTGVGKKVLARCRGEVLRLFDNDLPARSQHRVGQSGVHCNRRSMA